VTQEAHVTGLVDHEEVLERVTLLLAAVVFLLLFRRWIGRSVPSCQKGGGWIVPPSPAS
jgi:hypothetical protein